MVKTYNFCLVNTSDFVCRSCRCKQKCIFSEAAANASQLVWFENPKTSQLKPNWEVRVLSEHKEDVYFRVVEIPHPDGGMSTVIISSGFYRCAPVN